MSFHKENLIEYISAVVFGLGCILRKQFIKGTLYIISEISILYFIVTKGFFNLGKLITLGDNVQGKVWNEALSIYVYTDGDRSLEILLYGIVTLLVIGFFILLSVYSYRSSIEAKKSIRLKGYSYKIQDELKNIFDDKLHRTLLILPVTGCLLFTVLPLIFMICMAFTNYSVEGNHLVLFDWVGLENFKKLFSFTSTIGKTFWSVFGWTLTWAFVSTFLNYFLGLLLAIFINWKYIKHRKIWRFCFVLTVAVPHFVTLLIIRQMLQNDGAVNVLLRNWGIIEMKDSLPFFTNSLWARCVVILINAWVGIPYVLLQVTGILQNISPELYEAARMDGASSFRMFKDITLPYMLFVTTPFLIVSFMGNINNFTVIFLTSKGFPRMLESTAGKTDLLITWLYGLTIDNQFFNMGAVIGLLTFIVLSVLSISTFLTSKSNKEERSFA